MEKIVLGLGLGEFAMNMIQTKIKTSLLVGLAYRAKAFTCCFFRVLINYVDFILLI